MIKVPMLKTGDTVGVVAPAGAVPWDELQAGLKGLEALGFRPKLSPSIRATYRGMAGEDHRRAADLMQMFADPEVKAIFCARGGYGSARLIPLLDRELILKHPKIFMGCSDITILLLYLTEVCGVVAFHGPVVGPHLGKVKSPLTRKHLLKVLCQLEPDHDLPLADAQALCPGYGAGKLLGGCLSLWCSAIGTSYEPCTEGAILFLEDVNEAPYRIDRMLTHLKQAGKLQKVQGILFGQMPGCHPPPGSDYRLEDVIMDVLHDFEGPIVMGVPSGHGSDCITLPMGVKASLSVKPSSSSSQKLEIILGLQEPVLETS